MTHRTIMMLATTSLASALAATPAPAACLEDRPVGRFSLVDVRQSSGVAAMAPAPDARVNTYADHLEFPNGAVWPDGQTCESVSFVAGEHDPVWIENDPNLSDIALEPAGLGVERFDQPWSIVCDGQVIGDLVMVDANVLIASVANGSAHAIYHRALSPQRLTALEDAARAVAAPLGDPLLAETFTVERALAVVAEHHGAAYRFAASPWTMGLMAILGQPVCENE